METATGVWLADLTHTSRGIAADAFPYSVGCIASYLDATGTLDRDAMRLVKFPDQLARLARTEPPPMLVGFSNYMWNSRLSLAFASRIARRWPETVIVFGGPHYPLSPDERMDFLRAHPQIDFYVEHEGEQVFAALISALRSGARPGDLHGTQAGLHSVGADGTVHMPAPPARLPSIDAVPSPYVAGLMDPFFTGELVPLLETNRGCPFKCTFCSEGIGYYNRVTRRPAERTREELFYIGAKLEPLIKEGRARNELILADSNFGMFSQDQEICEALAECRDTYGWPAFVNATTGKNRKDQVLLAIQTARGALELTGSVQSLDEQVLKNVQRANVRTDTLVDIALAARGAQTGTYSEVILGLPGDSKDAHLSSMKKLVRTGFDSVRPYQLCFLPGTEIAMRETREKFGLVGRFRVLPRCFGAYEWLDGETVRVNEIDEICVAQDSLSFEEYLDCRTFDLFVHLFHNDGPFAGLERILDESGCDVGEWITACLAAPRPPAMAELVEDFRRDTRDQLHDTAQELISFVEDPENMARHIAGELGNNVLHTYRGRAFGECFADMVGIAESSTLDMLEADGRLTDRAREFVRTAVAYHVARVDGVLADPPEAERVVTLDYDVHGYVAASGSQGADAFRLSPPHNFVLRLTAEQLNSLNLDAEIEKSEASGRGRLLARTLPGSLWREVVTSSVS